LAGYPSWLSANAEPRRKRPRTEIDPKLWERPDRRRFLAVRDIAGVYRLLQRHGVSQRAIAALTGQSQSEIPEILSRGRQVSSYDLLVRIGEGLNIQRGWMGLAYDESTAAIIAELEVRS
jgi:hypothetical protein